MEQQQDKWSEYWQQEGAGGEVFVGKDGSTNPNLEKFWSGHLAEVSTENRIIDIASGAGSIFRHLPKNNGRPAEQHATDLSPEALKILKERIPSAAVTVASANKLPYASRGFDLVVSQFGIEYAGTDAFREAGRLLKAGGRLISIVHIENGYIDSKNQALLDGALEIERQQFIPLAIALTEAAFDDPGGKFGEAAAAFRPAEEKLAQFVGANRHGIHAHLYLGFRQLFQQKASYHRDDIVDWLTAMQADVERNMIRLKAMRSAALGREQTDRIVIELSRLGIAAGFTPLNFPGHELPVGWQLTGTRH